MKNVSIANRTTKKDGELKIRFRLRDGRNVDLYHKSDIVATIAELSKFDMASARVKAKVSSYNRELERDIQTEVAIINQAYSQMVKNGLSMNSDVFEEIIHDIKFPNAATQINASLFENRFNTFINDGLRDNIFGEDRAKTYRTLLGVIKRFTIINGLNDLDVNDVDADILLRLRQFLADEYIYVENWHQLYVGLRTIPSERRSQNTIATRMKILQAFFSELEDRDEISKSPFRKLGKERKKSILRERYDEPIYLKQTDLAKLIEAKMPKHLEETRKAFILQCSFGCRISDFKALSMENVSITDDGIPFIHYLPIKTSHHQSINTEIQTPIMKYALEIIKEHQFNFDILKNITGHDGYNNQIKDILRICKMDRQCTEFNETTGKNEYKPLWQFGSSKLARKTYVDMMSKVQVDLYASGLHKQGSKAVNHYTSMELNDRFILMCAAFNQPQYRVDNKLNVIE